MTPEEQLRMLLQSEAELFVPAGDGLQVIRSRIAHRRSWRRLRPLVGVAAAAALVVGGAVGTSVTDRVDTDRPTTATERPRPLETTAPEECATGGDVLCLEAGPSPPVPSTSGVTTSAPGTPFWPFTNDREAAAWARDPGARTWAADPTRVAQHLTDDYLQIPGLKAHSPIAPVPPVTKQRIELRAGTITVAVAELVRVGVGTDNPWSVVAVVAAGDGMVIAAPTPGQRINSPVAVAGTRNGVPETVTGQLRSSAGTLLGEAVTRSAADGAFATSLDWSALSWSTGSLTITSRTDGALGDLVVVAVHRAGAAGPGVPPAASTFVAVDRGAIVLHDASTGQRLRQLSYPPPGVLDSSPSRGGEGAVFVRRRIGSCTDELVRVSLGNGAAGITVPGGTVRREHPAVSPDGRLLAWVERPCSGGGSGELVVRGPDAREHRMPLVTERTDIGELRHLGVRDDGALVLEKASGGVSTLAPRAASVDQAVGIDAPPNCPDTAPAWSGSDLFLWRGCDGPRVGLLLAAPDYGHGLQSPSQPQSGGILATSVAQTEAGPEVLVALGGKDFVGPVGRLVDGRFVTVFANDGCIGATGSCLTDPTW